MTAFPAIGRFPAWFGSRYALDLRALALMRIAIAVVIITDLVIRSSDLSAHYTDEGLWPSRLAATLGVNPGYWSLHGMNGTALWQYLLFATHFLAALALLIGYRSRLSTFVLWILTISLHNRNLFILQAGDDLLRLTLFWGIFLPWDACYSVTSRMRSFPAQTSGIAGAGYLLLLASVYFFGFLHKTGADWWRDGSAVYYALSLEQLRLPFTGDLLYAHPPVMHALTRVVLATELLIAVLLLLPSRSGRPRWLAFVLIVLLHAGIGLTIYVGLFFVIGMCSAIGLIPGQMIDRIEKLIPAMTVRTRRPQEKQAAQPPMTPQNVFLASVAGLSLYINICSIPSLPYQPVHALRYTAGLLRMDQYWGMFSPSVQRKDGWLVFEGIDKDGNTWDLRWNHAGADLKKPLHIVSLYPSDRWRKLAENLQSDRYTFLRPLFGDYLLRTWNREHPERTVTTLNVYFMEKENLEGYRHTEVRKNLLCVSNVH
jgi:hypothetical protein